MSPLVVFLAGPLYWVPLALLLVALIVKAVVARDWYGIAQACAWTFLAWIPWTFAFAWMNAGFAALAR